MLASQLARRRHCLGTGPGLPIEHPADDADRMRIEVALDLDERVGGHRVHEWRASGDQRGERMRVHADQQVGQGAAAGG